MTTLTLSDPANETTADADQISNNNAAIEAVINGGLDTNNLKPSAGIVASQIAGFPADVTKKLRGDGTWGKDELSSTPFTSPVVISASTEATANTIVTAPSLSFDGAIVIAIKFVCPGLLAGGSATGTAHITLFEDGVSLGDLYRGQLGSSEASACFAAVRRTPAAGAHVYSVRGYRSSANFTVQAGPGGPGAILPGYLDIERV